QQSLINDALVAVRSGECRVAMVIGGEAKKSALGAERSGTTPFETDQGSCEPDILIKPQFPIVSPMEISAGIWHPVQQYAMIENSLRHHEAVDADGLDSSLDDIASLWERFNRVARTDPLAAFSAPMTAVEIASPSKANRPLAWPYNKWHSTQWAVNQAVCLIFTTLGTARQLGVAPERIIFPVACLVSSYGVPLVRRRDPWRWPAIQVLGNQASLSAGIELSEIPIVEIYSCFPAAVRVQQRELGLDLNGTPTFLGGMAFAGGPFNNFALQATARIAKRLRESPGIHGMVTTVSGMLTKAGLAIWKAGTGGDPPLVCDMAQECDQATEVCEEANDYSGTGKVVTFTTTYDGSDPTKVIVIAETPDGSRCVAISDDHSLACDSLNGGLVGETVSVQAGKFFV
ncbi:MAG TPA: hypothetical protein VMU77_05000, partial [Acidimicrobiales bacterium]|nr:hypothetical protein [Acidimicrobiales bacterium]